MNAEETPQRPGTAHRCPDCGSGLSLSARACPQCGLSLVGPTAQHLWWIDAELNSLDHRRRALADERPQVLARLRGESTAPPAHPAPVGGPAAPLPPRARPLPSGRHLSPRHHPTAPPPTAPVREMSRRSAQNVILGLGALLIGVAALVFAVWNWSDMGTGSRATVLGLTTTAFALLALPLHRRGLHATAESFGVVATALLCVDALALWILVPNITNGPGYTAAALAVIVVLLALYPTLVPLRAPRVLAAVLVQPIPILLLAGPPFDVPFPWLLTGLAATGLAGTVIVRFLGAPRPLTPVRTLYGAAVTVWAFSLVMAVFVVLAIDVSPRDMWLWWAMAATLLLCGATGLLMARRPGRDPRVPSGYSLTGLGALALSPLAAGPPSLPVLPRLTVPTWSLTPADMTVPAMELLGLDHSALQSPTHLVYLAAIVGAAASALVTVALMRPHALLATAVLLTPTTLLAPPLLLGLPQTVVVVWALVLGGGLVLGSAVMPNRLRSLPVFVGFLTLAAGLVWAMPERYTTLAALMMFAVTALIAAAGARRFAEGGGSREPGGRAAVLRTGSVSLWALTLLVGLFALLDAGGAGGTEPAQWWMLTATVLVAGATALLLGGAAEAGPRDPFSVVGVALSPAAPLVALGTQSPFVVAIAGALAALAVASTTRRLAVVGMALVAPPALLPLPLLLDAPLTVTVVWTVLVGAALLVVAALARRTGSAWTAWAVGTVTFALAFVGALSDWYTIVGVLVAVAATASVSAALARTRAIAVAATATATFGTGAFSLALLLAMRVPVEYAAFGPLVVVAAVAIAAPRLRSPLAEATEVPAAGWAVVTLVITVVAGDRLELVALALAVVGVTALAGAVRPGRWWSAVVGGLLMFCALWTVLAAWDVAVPEAYTVPPAIAFVVVGWEWARRAPITPSSWLTHAAGLLLLLGPTVWLALVDQDLGWRVPAALVVGVIVVVWGLRSRLQAPLALGGAALLVVSLRAFGPPLWDLTLLLPNWVPFAVVGLLLLLVGARYEANLARLRRLGGYVGALR